MSTEQPATNWPDLMKAGAFELRTPIGVLAGYLRRLQAERLGPLTEKQRHVDRPAFARIPARQLTSISSADTGILPGSRFADLAIVAMSP
jgi:hypothetical protein